MPRSESRLHEPILSAVEADDRGSPSGLEAERQDPQQLFQVRQLPIDKDAESLKSPGRGVEVPALRHGVQSPSRALSFFLSGIQNHAGEVGRSLQRMLLPGRYDRLGDQLGIWLVAEFAEGSSEIFFGDGGQDLRSRSAARLIHAHVQGAVPSIREASLRVIDLHAGHPQVSDQDIDAGEPLLGQDCGETREIALTKGKSSAQCFQPLPGPRQILDIEVDADQPAGRTDALKQLQSMSSPTDGAIRDDITRLGLERPEHFLQQHRPVFAGRRASLAAAHLETLGLLCILWTCCAMLERSHT